MGQQQILLIILGVVIVGIAIAVAFPMFMDQAAATNRDEIVNELTQFAATAQGYYRRPSSLGGGGSSFNGLTMKTITRATPNLNGSYTLTPDPVGGSPTSVTITGVGTEIGSNGVDKVTVVMVVYQDSCRVDETKLN